MDIDIPIKLDMQLNKGKKFKRKGKAINLLCTGVYLWSESCLADSFENKIRLSRQKCQNGQFNFPQNQIGNKPITTPFTINVCFRVFLKTSCLFTFTVFLILQTIWAYKSRIFEQGCNNSFFYLIKTLIYIKPGTTIALFSSETL